MIFISILGNIWFFSWLLAPYIYLMNFGTVKIASTGFICLKKRLRVSDGDLKL